MNLPQSIQNNPFLCPTIKEWIYSNNLLLVKNEINKNVICYTTREYTDKLQQAFHFFYDKMNVDTTDTKRVTIYFYPSPIRKELNQSVPDVTPCEINSASTTFYMDRHEIVIWREQEWIKVLFHELIHAYELDKRMIRVIPEKDNQLSSIFPHYNRTPYEIYSEIVGTLLFYMYTGKNIGKLNSILRQSISNIINTIYGGDITDFFSSNPSIVLTHDTNTASYLVMKSVYFWNLLKMNRLDADLDTLLRPFKSYDKDGEFYDIFIRSLTGKNRIEYVNWLKSITMNNANSQSILLS